ncbi:MAG: NAD-dependent protein deacylase [Gammaproteobacteria bacterium]|jgi:NAD-dependent deacetylase|nr:NAD-dependent protein deacylase [Gammaproteobacteria bacterium]MBQ0773991.1 NAD-dependent protein deacylase [Gammaproteobacteria bacterium]|tara:strand:+ start:29523 stop:30281 length:759 start_codon:yes stop_codon:yes gene_type:complete
MFKSIPESLNRIVILTGAGVSAESGIQTFRGADGLWENHRLEDVAMPEAFARDPLLVQRFYNERRRQLTSASTKPNAAHLALAKLESAFDGNVLLVTQNIDNLHERAGSKHLIHMHGELMKARCIACGETSPLCAASGIDIDPSTNCRQCARTGTLRPHIVWFGEIPLQMDDIYHALASADLFISIGTSGNVYPAAGFVDAANQSGATTVELNLEASATRGAFKYHYDGAATTLVPAFVDAVLQRNASDRPQ